MKKTIQKLIGVLSICALIALICGCSSKKELRIGVDSGWNPQDFQDNQIFVNGFVEELLLEISKDSGVEFYRINANWDSLFDGLMRHRYEVVISSMPPYNFNLAKYEFSKNFLDIGPVLVVKTDSQAKKMNDLSNHVVGVLSGDQELLAIQAYPNVIAREYDSIPDIFLAIMNGEVDGIVVDRLHAINYISGSYQKELKIVGPPLNSSGLHFITLKNEPSLAMEIFEKSLKHLTKKKKLHKLRKKWSLDI